MALQDLKPAQFISAVNWKLWRIKDSRGPSGAGEETEGGNGSQGDGAAAVQGETGKPGTLQFGEKAAEKGYDWGLPAHKEAKGQSYPLISQHQNQYGTPRAPTASWGDPLNWCTAAKAALPGDTTAPGKAGSIPAKTVVTARRWWRKTCNWTIDLSIQAFPMSLIHLAWGALHTG